jgi:DUF1680 family protein
MKKILLIPLLVSLCSACALREPSPSSEAPLLTFALEDVRLLQSPFKHAEQIDLMYIMSMDPDRLLAPYLREAGLPVKEESYGNWESTGLDGHIGGHYLSALSLMVASTGNEEAHRRLDYMISELKRAQDANGNGYIGGVPGGESMWHQIAKGEIEADLFALNDKWVPWYNLHKVYSGLRDAYIHAGNEQAKQMLIDLTDWSLRLVEDLTAEQVQSMLRTEYGGMNEIFADVAAITGEQKYLELARKFSHEVILDPLVQEQDQLTGLHANTQIPKVIGFKRVAEVAGSEAAGSQAWTDAARFFWDTVVNERTVAIGGNSVREHFHDKDNFESMISEPEGPETCNTYNMLKLSKMLYLTDASLKYIDYYERALYNHILSSQHPQHGGLVYFTPMRPSHYRVYSQPEEAMWCCVGSGIENHAKYGELIYAHSDDQLYVNLFIPSTLNWREKGVLLEQQTDFPDAEQTQITIKSDAEFGLNIRYPTWVKEGALKLAVNDKPVEVNAQPGDYVTVDRHWKAGDQVTVTLPMHTQLEQMPDQSDYYAVLHGPIVLAAKTAPFPNENLEFLADDSRMGHIAQGPTCPVGAAPIFVSDTENFVNQIQPVPGRPITFTAPDLIQNSEHQLTLIPFFRLHDSRYVIYWPWSTPEQLEATQKAAAEAEKVERELDAITIDQVAPGEQQPESDHFFKGEATEAGIHKGRHWRHAQGWFSYQLTDENREAKVLRITYYGMDGGRNFDILMNGVKVANVNLEASGGDQFYTVDYAIPDSVWKNAEGDVLATRFEAHRGSTAGGIYGVRLLRAAAN